MARTLSPPRERKPQPETTSALDDLDLQYAGSDDLVRIAARLVERGEYAAAEDLLRQAAQLDPENLNCRAYQIICIAGLGRGGGEPERMARKLIDEHSEHPAGWFAMGCLDLLADRRAAAFVHFAQARAQAPRDRRLAAAIERLDPRGDLVFPSLPRDHDLNVICGRIRHMLERLRRR